MLPIQGNKENFWRKQTCFFGTHPPITSILKKYDGVKCSWKFSQNKKVKFSVFLIEEQYCLHT